MTQVCVIFGAGEYYAGTPVVPAGAYVIAADGGLDHTRQLGIVPDVVVGDFDSLEGRPPRTDVRTIALPALKDDPDMLSALKVGDRISTIGGIFGTITAIKDDTMELTVGKDNVKLIMARWAIRQVEDVKVENDVEVLN